MLTASDAHQPPEKSDIAIQESLPPQHWGGRVEIGGFGGV